MPRSKQELKINNQIFNNLFGVLVNTIRSIRIGIQDTAITMIPQVVSLGLGLITSILIARGLGPVEMGRYALIISVSSVAIGLSDLGISRTALRYASIAVSNEDIESQYAILRWAFRIRMMLVLVITTIIFLLTPMVTENLWHSSDLTILVWISLLTGIFGAIAAVPTIYLQSIKRFKMNAVVLTGQSIIIFIGIILLLIVNTWKIEYILLVTIISTALGALFFIICMPKEAIISLNKIHEEFKLKNIFHSPISDSIKSLDKTNPNKFAIFMVITSIISIITSKTDVWLMGAFLSKTQIGVYSVATYFTYPLVAITLAVNTVLWPYVSSLKTKKDTIKSMKLIVSISLISALLFALYSIIIPLFTPYLFGNVYNDGIIVAQILCIAYSIIIIYWPLQVFAMNFGYIKHFWWINGIQLLIVIIVNIALLPKIGSLGSGIALFLSYSIGLIITILFIIFNVKRDIAENKSVSDG